MGGEQMFLLQRELLPVDEKKNKPYNGGIKNGE